MENILRKKKKDLLRVLNYSSSSLSLSLSHTHTHTLSACARRFSFVPRSTSFSLSSLLLPVWQSGQTLGFMILTSITEYFFEPARQTREREREEGRGLRVEVRHTQRRVELLLGSLLLLGRLGFFGGGLLFSFLFSFRLRLRELCLSVPPPSGCGRKIKGSVRWVLLEGTHAQRERQRCPLCQARKEGTYKDN